MSRRTVVDKLRGGDRRSIGRSGEVVAEVLADPSLFPALIDAMVEPDPLVRMRAADAVEKVSRSRRELLEPHRRRLLNEVAQIPQQEIRWHIAQLVPRLELMGVDREQAVELLIEYLDDASRIVKAFAMPGARRPRPRG